MSKRSVRRAWLALTSACILSLASVGAWGLTVRGGGSDHVFAPLHLYVAQRSVDGVDLTELRRPKVSDLEPVLGHDRARVVIDAANGVFRYFDFDGVGPREVSTNVPEEIRRYAGGQCALTVAAFRDLAGVDVRQMDYVVPAPDGRLGGHSIAYLPGDGGHVLVDTTFGLVLAHRGPLTIREAFRQGAYDIWKLGETAPEYQAAQGDPAVYYDAVGAGRASFALPGEFLQAATDVIDIDPVANIGALDGSGVDITRQLGTYHDHLGSQYRPTHQVWRLRGKAGQYYRVSFQLLDPWTHPLEIDIAVVDDAGNVIRQDDAFVPNEVHEWSVHVTAPTDRFDLVITTDLAAGRFIDAVTLAVTDDRPRRGLDSVF